MASDQTAQPQQSPASRTMSIDRLQSIRRTGGKKSTPRTQQGANQAPIRMQGRLGHALQEQTTIRRRASHAREFGGHRSAATAGTDRHKASSSESASARMRALSARSVRRTRRTARPLGGLVVSDLAPETAPESAPGIAPEPAPGMVLTPTAPTGGARGRARNRIMTARGWPRDARPQARQDSRKTRRIVLRNGAAGAKRLETDKINAACVHAACAAWESCPPFSGPEGVPSGCGRT